MRNSRLSTDPPPPPRRPRASTSSGETYTDFGDDAVRFHTQVTTDCDVLPEGYDGSWRRERPAG